MEVHVQLATASKLFCSCAFEFGTDPNKNVCPVCLGLPGTLPVLNKKAVELAFLAARGLNCNCRTYSVFARKHYFYPDFPKGYQITQYEQPLAEKGSIKIKEGKEIGIKRVQLEEDTGKLIYMNDRTLIDFNRAGVPLIEIVTEPVINSTQEAYDYLRDLRLLLIRLGVTQGDMEKGQLRCEPNISIKRSETDKLGTRCEIKNVNSLFNVREAIEKEILRQVEIVESGNRVVQTTMDWDDKERKLIPSRVKEAAEDYRYFPEPDLPPLIVTEDYIQNINAKIDFKSPYQIRLLLFQSGIPPQQIETILNVGGYDFFNEILTNYEILTTPQKSTRAANFFTTEILGYLNEKRIDLKNSGISPLGVAELLSEVDKKHITSKTAKEVFIKMVEEKKSPIDIIKRDRLRLLYDVFLLDKIVKEVIENNTAIVE